MHEHITRTLYYLEVHLLYASLVWFAAWLLTSIRGISATTKYWIWVTTSVNFILPVGELVDELWARHVLWATPISVLVKARAGIIGNAPLATLLCIVWLLGATLMCTRLLLRMRSEYRDAAVDQKAENPSRRFLAQGVPVTFAASAQSPAVNGLLRPYIVLPDGIERLLSRHELHAVLIHELTHARRRDNLIRLVYEVGLCLLWFHPLLWISGSRLALYRELSCDESVIKGARGEDLVSALAKLVCPEHPSLLRAAATSHLRHRLALLVAAQPQRLWRAANTVLTLCFSAVLLGGILATVAHTACCFVD